MRRQKIILEVGARTLVSTRLVMNLIIDQPFLVKAPRRVPLEDLVAAVGLGQLKGIFDPQHDFSMILRNGMPLSSPQTPATNYFVAGERQLARSFCRSFQIPAFLIKNPPSKIDRFFKFRIYPYHLPGSSRMPCYEVEFLGQVPRSLFEDAPQKRPFSWETPFLGKGRKKVYQIPLPLLDPYP